MPVLRSLAHTWTQIRLKNVLEAERSKSDSFVPATMASGRPVVVAFAAGTAAGIFIAVAVARYALSRRRQWSWREWRSWKGIGLGSSPPCTPTSRTWSLPEPNGHAQTPFASSRPGNTSNGCCVYESCGSKPLVLASPPPVAVSELASQQDDILCEQFTRNAQFFGSEGQMRVHSAFVVIIGLGGVGSHAATMLLRAGVGRLRVVDFDQVSLSSLNRHAVATRADVGTPKAECLKRHFLRIFPEAEIDACNAMFQAGSEDDLLCGQPDFVLDCIDNIDTKVALLAACKYRGLQVLSATGAGARADPTRIRIADISESFVDPLARVVRHRLRKLHGIEQGVRIIFSTERPKTKLLPFENPLGDDSTPLDYQVVPGFRIRVIPVLGTIPAIFGQTMATYVITQLAGMPVRTEPVVYLAMDHYALLHRRLLEREENLFGTSMNVEMDVEEVMYVVKELWRGRSARDLSGRKPGRSIFRSMNNLTLTRWDLSQPPSVANVVLLTFEEADQHEMMTLGSLRERDPVYFEHVTAILARAWDEFCS